MSTSLEEIVVNGYLRLKPDAQERVRRIILNSTTAPREMFDWVAWLEEGKRIGEMIEARRGKGNYVDVQELLDEVREENSRWPQ